ncbi:DNA helicase [Sphingomonas sp. VNH70]|uniref:DNA helicase n=1 Tax=Sphingomonas silueang TaxID=3156617 RepID=UPI0032B43339
MPLSAPIHFLKRRARSIARETRVPLHQALDDIARSEGFRSWSALSAQAGAASPPASLLPELSEGDMLLLGARPGQGKTMLGLQLLVDGTRDGRRSVFFTREITEREARHRLRSLGGGDHAPEIVAGDDIDADCIVRHLMDAPRGSIGVIDYLQILDQQRRTPVLGEQLARLARFAQGSGVILTFLSQIERGFDAARRPLPGMADVRLPNAIPPGMFSKACFLHGGRMGMQATAPV